MSDHHGLCPLLEQVRGKLARADARERASDPAWNELAARLRLFVRAFFLVRVRQAAEASELAQEVQVRVARSFFDGFRGSTVPELLAWVQAIARRVLADQARRLPPDALALSGDELAVEPAGTGLDPELTDRVLRSVETLPEPGRGIVTAFYLEGRSCEEIARQMSRPAGWVRVKKLHAVRALRDRLRGNT
jgi:RNA polymerase sigma factor (sigma-70 family)